MRLIALAPLLMAAACGGGPLTTASPGRGPQTVDTSAVPSGPGVENSCGAGRQISLLGKDATVLEKVMILGPVQVLRPGSIAAQDFQPDRINFIIGPDNRITQITCG
ncbi:Peptidase inhibitor I78 family protein [Loktanella atrilutea]|uniref:Peptidase inhibitor I78 family protein n=1 Tax=Loktanella atrilutea TaxID=366533 RepID=A0A1M5BGG4_LOKAT|nr:I78 family peptidase inhibitor [Loktanella atrilutea]SHF41558.1 Peptidase inhibitor I78 family protein [Loktanella atrilutea]